MGLTPLCFPLAPHGLAPGFFDFSHVLRGPLRYGVDRPRAIRRKPLRPLQHFRLARGRDPSVGFDTTSYLAAYADVNAAHVNPLTHFLQYGIHEGRSAFADGVWG